MIFVCDVMLGKLARYLRMLGLDAPYARQGEDRLSLPEGRAQILFLTKSSAKADRPETILVHSNDPKEQLLEIKGHIEPYIDADSAMTRCIECNVPLASARKEDIEPFVPEYVYHHNDEFRTCPSCHKVYWKGSHAHEMKVWMEDVLRSAIQ